MQVIWHKVWADLWWSKGRSALVVVSIAAGVFAVGGIFGMVDLLLDGMDRAHRAVHPSHLNVILRGVVDRQTVAELERLPGVEAIEPLNQLSIRIKTSSQEEWSLASLVMRDDYARQAYDVTDLVAGQWPGQGAIAVERLTSQYLGVGLGDEVIIDVRGTARRYTIDGVVRHPFVKPPAFGGLAVFFVDASELEAFGVPPGRYGQLLVRVTPYEPERVREVAGAMRSLLGQHGVDVAMTLTQDPNGHWGRRFAEGVTVMLQIIAVISLLLSVVLVMTMMHATITQQTSQIGVIKAIGGRRKNIIVIYLTAVLVYGAAAFVVATPLGVVFAHGMTRWFLNLFNIEYEAVEVSLVAVALQALSALVAPGLAALVPVLKGARISVREAIASYGLGGDFGSSPLDRAVERIGTSLLPTLWAAALGNMFRRKGRLVLTMLVLVIAGVMFLVVMSLTSSIAATLDADVARRQYTACVGFTTMQSEVDVLPVARDVEGVERAELWYRRNALILREGERRERAAGLTAQLLGLPPTTDLYRPLIVSGRWLRDSDHRAVVMSADMAAQNDIDIGDRISLDLAGVTEGGWEVVGTYRQVVGTGFALEPLYAPRDVVFDAFGGRGQGTQLYIVTTDRTAEGVRVASDELRRRLEARGIGVDPFASSLVLEDREAAGNQFQTVINLFLVLALLIAAVGGIGLAGALAIAVVERTREIGVMRATGASSRQLTALFVAEGVLQGLSSWAVAVPIGYFVARPAAVLLGQTMLDVDLDFAFHGLAIVYWLAIVLAVSILASFWPARRAARLSVREALAYQ